MLGFAPQGRDGEAAQTPRDLGAFVTNPISLRPRRPAARPACIAYAGGFVLHTGLPNEGLRRVLARHEARWARSHLPIIVHLIADRPDETRQMVGMLEGAENVMAAELGFAPLLTADILRLTVELCRGELPLICSLPREQVLGLGPRLIEEGAAAISFAPPRGAVPDKRLESSPDGANELVTGRLFGPSLLPQTLELVRNCAKLGLPVIGGGGIWKDEDIGSVLGAGAIAAQVDAWHWLPAA